MASPKKKAAPKAKAKGMTRRKTTTKSANRG